MISGNWVMERNEKRSWIPLELRVLIWKINFFLHVFAAFSIP